MTKPSQAIYNAGLVERKIILHKFYTLASTNTVKSMFVQDNRSLPGTYLNLRTKKSMHIFHMPSAFFDSR